MPDMRTACFATLLGIQVYLVAADFLLRQGYKLWEGSMRYALDFRFNFGFTL